jgi:hypothetical protein
MFEVLWSFIKVMGQAYWALIGFGLLIWLGPKIFFALLSLLGFASDVAENNRKRRR